MRISTHAPAGGATIPELIEKYGLTQFLLTPLREGRHTAAAPVNPTSCISTHAPAGGATRGTSCPCLSLCNFYSRPCGRGDLRDFPVFHVGIAISTHAPAGGATLRGLIILGAIYDFYSRPCGRGDRSRPPAGQGGSYFYSRPCGRGDARLRMLLCFLPQFLLTPLREGRRGHGGHDINGAAYFYSRPCGRGDVDRLAEVVHEPNFYSRPCGRGDEAARRRINERIEFLLTPLREGRLRWPAAGQCRSFYFYSRPCGRGDVRVLRGMGRADEISTHAPAGGATKNQGWAACVESISTHAPAGGATGSRS